MTSPNTPLSALAQQFDNIEGLEKALSLMWKLAILYGGVWIFHYCYFGIGYTPVGLSVGDGVYWLFLSIGIGITAIALAAMGALSLWPFMGLAQLSEVKPVMVSRGTRFWTLCWDPERYRVNPWLRMLAWLCLLTSVCVLCLVFAGRFWETTTLDEEMTNACLYIGMVSFAVFVGVSHKWGRGEDGGIAAGLALASTLAYIVLILAINHKAVAFIAAELAGGVFMGILFYVLKQPMGSVPHVHLVAWLFGLLVFFAPLWAGNLEHQDGHNFMSQQVFRQLGLSHVDVNVLLKGDAARMVEKLIDQEALSAMTCKLEGDALQVSGIDVPWNGLGAKALLSFPAPLTTKSANNQEEGRVPPPTRLAVDSDQVFVLSEARTRCADLPTAVYFPSGRAVTSDREAIDKLRQELADMQALAGRDTDWKVDKFIVEAHSDAMPLGRRSSDGNDELARARAKHVLNEAAFKAVLGPDGPQPSVEIHVQGSRHPEKGGCGMRGEPAALAECEAVNRRVQVRVLWRRSPRVAATQ